MTIVPLHKTPTKQEAQNIVRQLVAQGRISWSKHAKERMKQRGINMQQVLTCLAKGGDYGTSCIGKSRRWFRRL